MNLIISVRSLVPKRVGRRVLVSFMILLPVAVPGGGVVTVPTEANLRAAMVGGGTVRFACDGVITLTSTITNSLSTALDASGHQITISGGKAVRVFWVSTNTSLALSNLAIANGRSEMGAGVYIAGGQLILQNCTLACNSATGQAGANYSGSPGTNGCGGAVYNSGVLNASACAFFSNSVAGGVGAPGAWPNSFGGAGGDGNGGAIGNVGTLVLTGCLLAHNSARGGAGGTGAGGIYGTWNGTPGYPGGLGGSGNGGAIFNQGTAVLVNSTVALNLGTGGQGGNGGPGGPPSSQSAFSGDGGPGSNGGSGYGAIADVTGQCYLTNCTMALNDTIPGAGGTGGPAGPWPYPYPPHVGQPGGNGIAGPAGSGLKTIGAHLLNTLFSSNTPGNCSGTIVDAGHNLSSDASCVFTNFGSLNNTDPKLGPLADNGGPTLTMALLAGSPAIDAGDNTSVPLTDQRGVARDFGAVTDIGAYEYATLLSISRSQVNGLKILLRDGSPGQACRLLTSTDFSSWLCLTTNQVGTNGTFLFQTNCNPSEAQRYYKAVMP